MVQLTSIQFFFNQDKINLDCIYSWVYKVTKNYCMQHFRNIAREKKILSNVYTAQDKFMPQVEGPDKSIDFSLEEVDFEIYSFISSRNKEILKKYFLCKKNLSELSRDYKINKGTLRNKIHNLIKEIRFYHLLNQDVKCFSTLPGTKFHENINNFLKKLQYSINNNQLGSMKYYLKGCTIHKDIESINIKEVLNFNVKIKSKKRYRLIVGYKDFLDKVCFFFIDFTIKDGKSINVIEFPVFPKRVTAISLDYVDGEKGTKGIINSKGTYNMRFGEIDAMIKKGIAEVYYSRSKKKDKCLTEVKSKEE